MRGIAIITAVAILVISTFAAAAETEKTDIVTLAVEGGYIVLHEPISDEFDDAECLGLTLSYHFRPHVWLELPIQFSAHEGDDLPEGRDAELSMATVTPGFAFGSGNRLRYWLFLGGGVNMIDSTVENGDFKADTSTVGYVFNSRAGIDLNITRGLFAGLAMGVITTRAEFEELRGGTSWDTFSYYNMNLRIGYTF